MALRLESVDEWNAFFSEKLNLSATHALSYAQKLYEEGYCDQSVRLMLENTPSGQPSPALLTLGIKPGHCLRMAVYFLPKLSGACDVSNQHSKLKIPRPLLNLDANQVEFDQFVFEWKTYRSHYNIPPNEFASHLFYCGNDEVRKRIRIEDPSFTTSNERSESQLIDVLKGIVLSKISKIVHIKQFYCLVQSSAESCNDYLAKLQSKASCCGFLCTHCGKEGSMDRVKEQFIIGLANKAIQTALLKTESVCPGTTLERLLAEALTLEQTLKDQISLTRESSDMLSMEARRSSEMEEEEDQVKAFSKPSKFKKSSRICAGCGTREHSSYERQKECPAWGKKCFNCGTMNHFSKCCRSNKGS